MSEQSYRPIVSSHQSKVVAAIIDALGIHHLPILGITIDFQANKIAMMSIDVAVTDALDTALAAQMQTTRYQLMEPAEQVNEQITLQEY